jgi:hypothetical protein
MTFGDNNGFCDLPYEDIQSRDDKNADAPERIGLSGM